MGEGRSAQDEAELVRLGELIRTRCAEFGVEGTVEAISPGPVITVFEFQPAPGVKVSQIVNLQDDLALALKAESVRIDRMPGRSTLGIEVPNRERSIIRLGNMLADERFRKSPSVLTMAIGTDIHGEPYYADLATMPHLLVAGATGAGKSVGLQSMITSILYKATRDEVQFIFIDPKRIELGVYADIPHLKCEVVVDPEEGGQRPALGGRRDGAPLPAARRGPRALDRLLQPGDLGPGDAAAPVPLRRRRRTVHRRRPEAAAVLRGGDRRARRPDDGLLLGGRDLDRPPGADGPRRRHPPDRGHPAAVGRRADRHDQGELPLPHLLRHRQPPRLAHHPRPGRLREAPRQGGHADDASRLVAGDAPARRLHLRAGDGGADPLAQEARQARARSRRPQGSGGRMAPPAAVAATTTTTSTTRPPAW